MVCSDKNVMETVLTFRQLKCCRSIYRPRLKMFSEQIERDGFCFVFLTNVCRMFQECSTNIYNLYINLLWVWGKSPESRVCVRARARGQMLSSRCKVSNWLFGTAEYQLKPPDQAGMCSVFVPRLLAGHTSPSPESPECFFSVIKSPFACCGGCGAQQSPCSSPVCLWADELI